MRKGYAVIEFGGEYEDAWEHTVAVCLASEDAELLKSKIEKNVSLGPTIPFMEYDQAMADYYNEYPEDNDVIIDKLLKITSEHSKEEWESAISIYESNYYDFRGVDIKEVDIVTDTSDILKLSGNNS